MAANRSLTVTSDLAGIEEHRRQRERLLRNLIMPKANDAQIELALEVCERYGWDPLLRHVVFIGDNLYVTRDGLIDNAHRSGQFDGIQATAERDEEGHWTATATVWRKDMSHPFVYSAYEPEHRKGTPSWGTSPRAMTIKCAEVMALRRAFDISLGTAEEMGFDAVDAEFEVHERPAPAQKPMPRAIPPGNAKPSRVEQVQALTRRAGLIGDDLRRVWSALKISASLWSELTEAECDALAREAQKRLAAQAAAEAATGDQPGPQS